MRDLDQGHRSFPDRFPEQVGDTVLCDHVVHVGPRDPHPVAGRQQGFDPRSAFVGGGGEADNGLAAGGSRRAADEADLRGYTAVELAFELVDADLARQVDREGLGDRDHVGLPSDLLGIAYLIDRQEHETRIVTHEVVEPPRPQTVAGDDTTAMARLAVTRHRAGLDQVQNAIGDDVAMDAEVAPIPEMAQRFIGDAAQPDLERRAVVYNRSDVARNALRDLAGLRMEILRHGYIDVDQCIEAVEMDEALAVGAWHRRIDFGDDAASDPEDRGCKIHGHAEADEASGIRRRNLKQCHVDRQPSARQKFRHLLQRDWHVIELAATRHAAHFAADETHPVAIASMASTLHLRQR